MPGISAKPIKKAAMLAGADLVGIASTDRFDKYPEENRQSVSVNIIKELMDLRKALRKDCRAWDYSLLKLHGSSKKMCMLMTDTG